ncbi:MAG: dienelactone hydrolase family protein [Ancalomicrobiaceae bacterium]|nr:dienelactone hydrolase family protein [Ancalomicrobiaceae bacterium]
MPMSPIFRPSLNLPSRRAVLVGGSALIGLPFGAGQLRAFETEPADARVAAETLAYPAAKRGTLKGYLARPKAVAGRRPGVIVIHEIRGINGHFRDLARRLALEGMIGFVPDLASAQNYDREGSDEVRDYLQKLPVAEAAEEYRYAIDFLSRQPDCSGAIGIIGFAWGGPIAAEIAAMPAKPVKAAVLYYSLPTSVDLVTKFTAPVLLQYAELDPHTQPQIDTVEKKLIGYSKVYEQYVYDGAKPNFANESLTKWYNKAQADLAWGRTVNFLKRQLNVGT